MAGITFYATISYGQTRDYMPGNVSYMLPASSWSRNNLSKPKLPPQVTCTAADCGGFVATKIWGDYRYSPERYVEWLKTFTPSWAATMDYCCEEEITGQNDGVIRERQQRTTEMAYLFWRDYRDMPWAWVPTIQGWEVSDYVRHAREMRTLIYEMQRQNEAFRVGVGTLCARASANMVQRVVNAVAAELPGIPLHLWGVKLGVLKSNYVLRQVISVDSAAWCPGGLGRDGVNAKKEQESMGLSQAKHRLTIALPRYLSKVDAALMRPKQAHLF